MDEQNVAKPAEEPQQDSTPVEKPVEATTPSGEVAKETPKEPSQNLHEHPRFKEVVQQKNEYKNQYDTLMSNPDVQKILNQQVQGTTYGGIQNVSQPDPLQGLSEEQKAIKEYETLKTTVSSIKSTMEQQAFQAQLTDAKTLAGKIGVDLQASLPRITEMLQRPENRGRLTLEEALMKTHTEVGLTNVRNMGRNEALKEKDELMAKKKDANLQSSTVSPNAVIQTDELARSNMTRQEKLNEDVKWAIEQARQGVRNPNVRVD